MWVPQNPLSQHRECHSKQSLVVEIKDKEPNTDSESDPKNNEKI
jgi:hypothetical protein